MLISDAGQKPSPTRLLEMLADRFGAFEAIANASIKLARVAPEEGSGEIDARQSVQQLDEFLAGQLSIAENFAYEPGTDGFTRVHGYHSHPAVWMLEEVVAAFDPNHLEPSPAESPHHLGPCQARQTAHAATEIR
jgi:hypothetical protein